MAAHDRELVTTEEHVSPPERVLLVPRLTPARVGPSFQVLCTARDLAAVLASARTSRLVALDFETKGNDFSDGIQIIGVGLAWDTGSVYFHWDTLSPRDQEEMRDFLLSHSGLLAHNVYFDGGVILASFGKHAQFAACTYACYMFTSNEGWVGQRWGLKEAMRDILLWENTNETELDEWLVGSGFYKGNRLKDSSPENLVQRYRDGHLSPEKGEMWQAPSDILGKYCVLDAEACYLLYTEHLLPVIERFPAFPEYLEQFMHLIHLHIDQKMWGLEVDTAALSERMEALSSDISRRTQELLAHPILEVPIREIETSLLADLAAKEPPRYLKQKERPPEPPKLRKDGAISKNWERWQQNGPKYLVPVQSLAWENWQERWKLAVNGGDPDYRFNLQSSQHLTELLYSKLCFPIRVQTDSGLPGTGVKALKHMGEIGGLLVERAYLEKELGYIQDYISRTQHRSSLHPSFRLPGTKTGRLTSQQPNLQQVPKSKAMMSLFRCRPGNILIDLDFSALEPVVATEFSQDENMLRIYGDSAPQNDVYLFVGAHIPGMGDKIRAAGYDPYLPTREGLAAAKKQCKHERSICKTVVLACQYGAGVGKVMSTLEQDDVFLTEAEVRTIHEGYWNLFPGVREFSRNLQREWKRNGGYVLNGMGRPMCLTDDYKHDCLNRFIQSTGHDILIRYVSILTHMAIQRNIEFAPWVIDWHDAAAVEVREEDRERMVECYLDSLVELNRQLDGTITLRGTPSWGYTMADIKEPEE